MRQGDDSDELVPATLGEYLEFCKSIGTKDNQAVVFLEEKIANDFDGADAIVLVPDSQMRRLLMPKLGFPPFGYDEE